MSGCSTRARRFWIPSSTEHAEETGLPVRALYVIEASFLPYDGRRDRVRTVVAFLPRGVAA